MNLLSKRRLLGLAAGAMVAGKSVTKAALNQALSQELLSSRKDYTEPHPESPGHTTRPQSTIDDLMSAAEKFLYAEKHAANAAARERMWAFEWNSKFLHSTSLSFRRARQRQLSIESEAMFTDFQSHIQAMLKKHTPNIFNNGPAAGQAGPDRY